MITSSDNQRLKEARKLQQRRQRYRTGTFLLEGVRLLTDAYQSQAHFQEVFYAPELIESNAAAQARLTQFTAQGIPCFACTAALFGTLTETVTPQGIAAIITMPRLPLSTQMTLTLILDGVRDPGNAGTLLRTAEAAGVEGVLFGPECVDPFNDKVVRAGMGAHFRLPLRVCADWDELRTLLSPAQALYMAQAHGAHSYDEVPWTQPAALIVGGEATGASRTASQLATAIAIPMHGAVESLNAAVAGAVILFEAARQRRRA